MASKVARPLRGLYAVTPELSQTDELVRRVAAAIDGGATMVQYRAKHAPTSLRLEQAASLAALCRARGVPLIVNDSVELALAVEADGVHIGRDDGDAACARRAMPRGILGVSCYADLDRARAAGIAGADYIGIGSVFPSGTKPAASAAPLELIARARAAGGVPVAAIGGITTQNAALAVAAGADMVAVISALFAADDVSSAARAFARIFDLSTSGIHDVRTQQRPL